MCIIRRAIICHRFLSPYMCQKHLELGTVSSTRNSSSSSARGPHRVNLWRLFQSFAGVRGDWTLRLCSEPGPIKPPERPITSTTIPPTRASARASCLRHPPAQTPDNNFDSTIALLCHTIQPHRINRQSHTHSHNEATNEHDQEEGQQ